MVYVEQVGLFKRLVAVLMLAAWLPATSHCLLESAGIIPTDECCQETDGPTGTTHECRDGCAALEDSFYKLQDHSVGDLAPLCVVVVLPDMEPAPVVVSPVASGWPPGSLSLREFVVRTSLPIRGPSLLS